MKDNCSLNLLTADELGPNSLCCTVFGPFLSSIKQWKESRAKSLNLQKTIPMTDAKKSYRMMLKVKLLKKKNCARTGRNQISQS